MAWGIQGIGQLTLLLLAGCAHIHKDLGHPLPPDSFQNPDGTVHYGAVLATYGPPSKITALPSGFAFLYEHVEILEKQYGLILPGEIGRFFKLSYAKSVADTDVRLFTFDSEGHLNGARSERLRTDPGGGISFTLFFKIKSLSDTDAYRHSQEAILGWGRALLTSPPVALNAAQNLDSGAAGMEVIRTEGPVGQRALELRE